jgi:hypothetical protein
MENRPECIARIQLQFLNKVLSGRNLLRDMLNAAVSDALKGIESTIK